MTYDLGRFRRSPTTSTHAYVLDVVGTAAAALDLLSNTAALLSWARVLLYLT